MPSMIGIGKDYETHPPFMGLSLSKTNFSAHAFFLFSNNVHAILNEGGEAGLAVVVVALRYTWSHQLAVD